MKPDLRSAAGGAAAGVAATAAMSAFMLLAGRLGLLAEQAPRSITLRVTQKATGRRPSAELLDIATTANHVAVGAAWGLLYGSIVGRSAVRVPARLILGALYGAAIWAVMYAGLLPALRLMPPPQRDERRRPQVMIFGHLVFGVALALLLPNRSAGDRSGKPAQPIRPVPSGGDDRPVAQAGVAGLGGLEAEVGEQRIDEGRAGS
jgi:hypothetical protein